LLIICFNTETNRETTEGKSVYFGSSDELVDIVRGMDTQRLQRLRRDLKAIADRRYRWSIIAHKYAACLDGVQSCASGDPIEGWRARARLDSCT